jgi:deaminated glutathione amidase
MNSNLNIGVIQLTSGESVDNNVDQILQKIEKLRSVDLICTPENSLFFRVTKGKPMVGLSLNDSSVLKLQKFVDETKTPIMLGSIPLKEDGGISNATVFLEAGKAPQVLYRKIHLFDVDVPGAPPSRESEVFSFGAKPTLWSFRGWKIGLSICYDLRFSELYREYGKAGADLILIPSAFLVPTGQAHWEVLVRARAIENQCYVVAAAQGGEHLSASGEKRYTYGHSLVVNPWGEVVLELSDGSLSPPSAEKVQGSVTLEKSALEKVRRQIPMANHRVRRRWESEK